MLFKIIFQKVLSFFPQNEKINFQLQLLNKSFSDKRTNIRISEILKSLNKKQVLSKIKGKVILDVGTGWYPFGPIFFYLIGAKKIITYDHINHLRFGITQDLIRNIEEHLKQLQAISYLSKNQLIEKLERIKKSRNLEELLNKANIKYYVCSDINQVTLRDSSINLIFSYDTLEHMPKTEIISLTRESKRILKKNGIVFHIIGMGDHYSRNKSYVNFLRYPERLWCFLANNKINYHNRLREKEFIQIFESFDAKIKFIKHKIKKSDLEKLETQSIDKRFSHMSRKQVAIYHSEIIYSF